MIYVKYMRDIRVLVHLQYMSVRGIFPQAASNKVSLTLENQKALRGREGMKKVLRELENCQNID